MENTILSKKEISTKQCSGIVYTLIKYSIRKLTSIDENFSNNHFFSSDKKVLSKFSLECYVLVLDPDKR